MKNKTNFYSKWLLLLFFSMAAVLPALAQNDEREKDQKVEAMLEAQSFIFKAQSASPMRGRTIQLTSEYDLQISKDTLRTYLPFYGRAYSAPVYSGEGGIKITTTDFTYDISNKKRKRWNILIKPEQATGVQQLILSVSKSGYATLQVISTQRDPISFNGYITQKK